MRSRGRSLLAVLCLTLFGGASASQAAGRPNILWITSEDNGPQLGCYGDAYATTPNLDALSARGMRFLNVWSVAPVCAPARTAIISGMYPSSTGSEHMRSLVSLPAGMKMFPEILREHGYYCSNNSKEDYNLEKTGRVWDESSPRAHWNKRASGQPFFAVFNFTQSHESQIRRRPHNAVHPPSGVRVPSYHPDVPEVRQDWAQYYDQLTVIDAAAGRILKELEDAGLAEDTVVIYFGDHGSGMPRSKRTPVNSGLHVPLIVHVPPKFRSLAPSEYGVGGTSERLVSFVDLAPSLLSLAGIRPPETLQGRAFLGPFQSLVRATRYLHGVRGRMDERIDLARSVRDERYVYVRNYLPNLPHGQRVAYQFETPATRVWHDLFLEGKLNDAQRQFWLPRAPEELYDLRSDPDEVVNLAGSPAHRRILERLRAEQQRQAREVRDVGLLPEAEMHRLAGDRTPYELGHDRSAYPIERVLEAAERASRPGGEAQVRRGLADPHPAVRWWAVKGLQIHGPAAVGRYAGELRDRLSDESASVRVAAGEALAAFATPDDAARGLTVLVQCADLRNHGVRVAVEALNAIDNLGERSDSVRASLRSVPTGDPRSGRGGGDYCLRLLRSVLADPGLSGGAGPD